MEDNIEKASEAEPTAEATEEPLRDCKTESTGVYERRLRAKLVEKEQELEAYDSTLGGMTKDINDLQATLKEAEKVRQELENEAMRNCVRIHELMDERDKWISTFEAKSDEFKDMRQLVIEKDKQIEEMSELLWGGRCAYCGEIVGKECKNQNIGDEVLKAHVETCSKHPLAKAKKQIATLEKELDKETT